MESQSQNFQNPIDENIHFEMFPHEKALYIIACVRKAEHKLTEIGKIRAEIKNMNEDYRIQILANLRVAILQLGNGDIAKYLKEITN